MVSTKHTILLAAILVLAIIPFADAALRTQAQTAGWHDTLFTNYITPANDTQALEMQTRFGLTRFILSNNGGVTIGSASPSASTRGLYVHGALLANSSSITNGLTANSASIANGLTANSASITNALSANSATITNTLQANRITATDRLTVNTICLDTDTCRTAWPTSGGGGSGTINGSASTNQVAFFTNTQTLSGSNNLFFNGNQLGVGTSAPSATLDVDGTATFSGDVGIGTSTPTAKLDVSGNVNFRQDLDVGGAFTLGVPGFYGEQVELVPYVEQSSIKCTWNEITSMCEDRFTPASSDYPTCQAQDLQGRTSSSPQGCSGAWNEAACNSRDSYLLFRACLGIDVDLP